MSRVIKLITVATVALVSAASSQFNIQEQWSYESEGSTYRILNHFRDAERGHMFLVSTNLDEDHRHGVAIFAEAEQVWERYDFNRYWAYFDKDAISFFGEDDARTLLVGESGGWYNARISSFSGDNFDLHSSLGIEVLSDTGNFRGNGPLPMSTTIQLAEFTDENDGNVCVVGVSYF